MLDVALATSAEYPGLDEDSLPLLEALRALGLRCEPRVWDSGVNPAEPHLWLVRSTWDYDLRREEFLAWTRETACHATLVPSLDTLAWNTDKGYLRDLEARGAPTVPTAWLARGDSLAEALAAQGWESAVVKPAVAAGARGLMRTAIDEATEAQPAVDELLERGAVLVQPFLASIESHGELSLFFADGAFTHAVRKLALPGDFRVQPEYGGSFAPVEPTAEELGAAQGVLGLLDERQPVARVDLVTGDDGAPLLIELELVDPCLYLRAAPHAAVHFANAVARRLVV